MVQTCFSIADLHAIYVIILLSENLFHLHKDNMIHTISKETFNQRNSDPKTYLQLQWVPH